MLITLLQNTMMIFLILAAVTASLAFVRLAVTLIKDLFKGKQ